MYSALRIMKIMYRFIWVILLTWTVVIGQSQPSDSLGGELVVATYISPPFCMESESKEIYGLSVDMWELVAKELNLSAKLVAVPQVYDVIDGLQDGTYDAAIGALTITPNREHLVNFSHAVNSSGTGFAVAASNSGLSLWTYWRPIFFSLIQLFLQLLFGVFFFGTLIYFIERDKTDIAHIERRINGWIEGIWWSVVTMSTVGYGDKIPFTKLGKAIAMMWIFVSIVLVALFTAQASSIFTLTQLKLHVETEADLRRSRVGVVENSSGEEFCKNRKIKTFPYPTIEAALDELVTSDIDAVVSNVPVLRYAEQNKYINQIAISPNILLRTNMGIALPNNSPLLEPINRVVLEHASTPAWRLNIEHYLGTY